MLAAVEGVEQVFGEGLLAGERLGHGPGETLLNRLDTAQRGTAHGASRSWPPTNTRSRECRDGRPVASSAVGQSSAQIPYFGGSHRGR